MTVAVTHAGYIAAAWGIALVGIGAYAARVIQRGRSLARKVPPEDRRWT